MTASWTQLPPAPIGLAGHSCCILGESMYVFGGENQLNKLVNGMMAFDFANAVWTVVKQSGAIPSPRSGHSWTVRGSSLVLFGGHDGHTSLNDMYIFDSASLSWRRCENSIGEGGESAVPQPRTKHSAVLVNDQLVVYGGWDWENSFKDFHVFDFETSCWRRAQIKDSVERIWHKAVLVPPLAGAPGAAEAGPADQVPRGIFIFAGEDKNIFLQNDLFQISPDLGTFQRVQLADGSQTPGDRYGHCMEYVPDGADDSLVVFGGYGGEMTLYNDVLQFSLVRRQWRTAASAGKAPSGRHAHSSVLRDGMIYIFGGTTADLVNTPQLYRLQIDVSSPWVAVAAESSEPWQCNVCTFADNKASANACLVCGAPCERQQYAAAPSTDWTCRFCTFLNRAGASVCDACCGPAQ